MLACLTSLALASCATLSPDPALVAPPPVPGCLTPVLVVEAVAGEALITIAARERAALLEANRRIRCGADLWEQTRSQYGGG